MKPRSYVDIVDRRCLAGLLDAEMRRRELNQSETAEVLAIPQGDISKLLRGQRARLKRTAVHQIAEFLPREAQPRLEEALLGPEAREVLKAHKAWLDESLKPYCEQQLPIADPEWEPELTRSVPRPQWRWNMRAYDAFGALALLRADLEAGQEIRRFERQAAKLGFTADADALTADRLWLVIFRVFDPIAGDRARVERHYKELQEKGEIRKYLRHAFDRELVLLKRPSDLQRAQEWGGWYME